MSIELQQNNTEKVRDQGLDKFYTDPSYSKKCIEKVLELFPTYRNCWDLIVEPSAGNGSFYSQLPEGYHKIGLDISPEHPDIQRHDFFDYLPPTNQRILVIGNPPFGRVSSLAVKFFNHAAEWANVIAFIVPRTFRKISVQNKLHGHFKLVYDEEVPTKPCCFSPPMMVKCCFQIWEKTADKRERIDLPTHHIDWEFLGFGPLDAQGQPTPPPGADFAIRAYGGKIGEIKTEGLSELRPKSWHWIKSTIVDKKELIRRFSTLDYSNSQNTARQNSMGKAELISIYSSSNVFNTKF